MEAERKTRVISVTADKVWQLVQCCSKVLLTRKLCLMKVGDGLWAAGASDGDFFLSTKLLNIILKADDKHLNETNKN